MSKTIDGLVDEIQNNLTLDEARQAIAEVIEEIINTKSDLYFKREMPKTLSEYMEQVVAIREQLRNEQCNRMKEVLGDRDE